MPRFGLRIQDKRKGDSSERFFEFSDSEWAQLEKYLDHIRDLERSEFLQKGHGAKVGFNWKAGEGSKWTVELPPEDSLFALLHRMRPLILEKEPACFQKIRALLARRLDDPQVRRLLRLWLDVFTGKKSQEHFVFSANDEVINSEKLLQTWLNAHEYHRDEEKQKFLAELHYMHPLEWSKGIFVMLLVEKIKAIVMLGQYVQLVRGERESLVFNFTA